MSNFHPSPDNAVPYPGAPLFFKRHYNTFGIPEVQEPIDQLRHSGGVVVTPQMDIVIYGYSCRSPYPEDYASEDVAWERGKNFPGICFSEVEIEGEYGFTPLHTVKEISREEFEAAKARGWRP